MLRRFAAFRRVEAQRRKERSEAHLYMDVQVSPLALVVKFVHILAQRSYCTLCDFVFSHNLVVGTILSFSL